MPLPPALAAKLAKRGILQQSDTNASIKAATKSAEGTSKNFSVYRFSITASLQLENQKPS